MKLVVISHTEHYQDSKGKISGWGPTINELNHLAPHFESIVHVAMLHQGNPPQSALPYTSENISFVKLPLLGGPTFLDKLKLVVFIPRVLHIIVKTLKTADAFQLRIPTGIGVFLIPYLTLFSNKDGWYKYAGNWNQKQPPFGYRLQRWFLKKQKRKVTINGKWQKQLKHCITFENPCLTQKDIEDGNEVVKIKKINDKFNFCYVGRLERPKGVERIIKSFVNLSEEDSYKIGVIHLVGDGPEKKEFMKMADDSEVNIQFHGFLSREKVFEIYKQSHFFIMPTSASEGFPKVIAEANNFGCIPIVSNVSAIAQYIKHKENGYIFKAVTEEEVLEQIQGVLQIDDKLYQKLLKRRKEFVELFTYHHYNERIKREILN